MTDMAQILHNVAMSQSRSPAEMKLYNKCSEYLRLPLKFTESKLHYPRNYVTLLGWLFNNFKTLYRLLKLCSVGLLRRVRGKGYGSRQ